MYTRKLIIIITLIIFGVTASGCGSKLDRLEMTQAKNALKQGNMKAAITISKKVHGRSPSYISAKRFIAKLEESVLKSARSELEKKEYQKATDQAESLLTELNPQNEEAKAIRDDAKKYLLLETARKASAKNPIFGLNLAKQALELDPEFKEAKDLVAEFDGVVQEKITAIMATSKDLLEQKRYDELIKLTQTVLSIEPENKEASALLNEAKKNKLAYEEETNLSQAKKYFNERIYESAKASAELVLKANPNNAEAKVLLEESIAAADMPKLRLTGFTKIKGDLYAQLLIQGNPERFRVREGEEFGDFRIVLIDFDLKSVVIKYAKTPRPFSLTLGEE